MSIKLDEKSDILFLFCPNADVWMPSLEIGYLCSYLKSRGYLASLLDINVDMFNKVEERLKTHWQPQWQCIWAERDKFYKIREILKDEIDWYVRLILNTEIKILDFYLHGSNIIFSTEMAKRIRKIDDKIKIIFNGPFCFDIKNYKYSSSFGDFIVVGEAEEALFEIIQMIKDRNQYHIPGVITVAPNQKLQFSSRSPIEDLSSIPFPSYDESNLKGYQNFSKLPIILSRGCRYAGCTFCNEHSYQGYYRLRSVKDIIKEIKYHLAKNNVSSFMLKDAYINADLEQLNSLCNLIIQEGLNIKLEGVMRVREDMNLKLFTQMKEAGFWSLEYGIESGSNTILEKMKKGFTIEEAEGVLKLTHQAGIVTAINIIVGFPGEGEKEFEETIKFLEKNQDIIDRLEGLNICHLLPCSDLDKNRERYGIISPEESWADDWYSLDGNTLDIRLRRRHKIESLLPALNIKLGGAG